METINVFVDTSTVNRILDMEVEKAHDQLYEKDRTYLKKIINNYVEKGLVRLIVNPSVEQEIENTSDPERREQLLALFGQFEDTPHNKTIYEFKYPGCYVTEEDTERLAELRIRIPGFEKDQKVFLDAASNAEVEILLVTDRKHLAGKGLDSPDILVFTPKQFFEYLETQV